MCEIQLHIRSLYGLKDGQHEVYEWSRTLIITVNMRPEDLFKNMEPATLALMKQLVEEDWCSTGAVLPHLLHVAGEYGDAREILVQVSIQ